VVWGWVKARGGGVGGGCCGGNGGVPYSR